MIAIVALPVTALIIGSIVRFAYHRGMEAGYIACRLDILTGHAMLEEEELGLGQEDEMAATNGVRIPLTPPTSRRREPHP